MTPGSEHVWRALAATCRGAAHEVTGSDNQDACATLDAGGVTAVAVADGHGDAAHFRSRDGAHFAVDLAVQLMSETARRVQDPVGLADCLREQVTGQLVDDWRRRVLDHAMSVPIPARTGGQVDDGGERAVLRAYGTTLIALVATPVVAGFLQIGDGDAVAVFDDGGAVRPLPDDPALDGIHTTSMSQTNAATYMRVTVVDLTRRKLLLAMAATDGFAASQVDGVGWWRQVGEELAGHLRHRGAAYIDQKLPGWLAEPAATGGDDTTMALLLNTLVQP